MLTDKDLARLEREARSGMQEQSDRKLVMVSNLHVSPTQLLAERRLKAASKAK